MQGEKKPGASFVCLISEYEMVGIKLDKRVIPLFPLICLVVSLK